MYADDTVIYYLHKSKDHIREALQKDFDNFNSWLHQNELIINTKIGKTESKPSAFWNGKQKTNRSSLNINKRLLTKPTSINTLDFP